MCKLDSAEIASNEWVLTDDLARCDPLPAMPESVSQARDLTQAALVVWGLDQREHEDLVGNVLLVVSELATNALNALLEARIPDAHFRLVSWRQRKFVFVGVWDPLPKPEQLAPPDLLAEKGRGLVIVAALAKTHGFTPVGGGKLSWARLAI